MLVGCVTTFAGIGIGLGPAGFIIGAVFGGVLGIFGAIGNFFLQMQAMKELKQEFSQDVNNSSFLQKTSLGTNSLRRCQN